MLSKKEGKQLNLGLKHSCVNKIKNIKKLSAANMEKVENSLDQNQVENFHELIPIFSRTTYLQQKIRHLTISEMYTVFIQITIISCKK